MKVLAREDANALMAQQVIIDLRSLVKELLDNALDASASIIYIRICGTDSVQVTDNGKGISPADFPKLAAKGATSKLDSFEGLKNVVARGFRGEALFSIAQTCCLEIITKSASESTATKLTYWGGKLQSTETSSASEGTTVKVTNMFASLPVRRNDFVKNIKTQISKTVQMVQAYAILEDRARITLTSEDNGQLLVEGIPTEPLRVRAAQLFGRELENALSDVDFRLGDQVRISGVLFSPSRMHDCASREMQLFYINRRLVHTPAAFKSALKNTAKGLGLRNPIYALHLQIPPEQLDINLTPDKMEVRVLQEKAFAGKFYTAVQEFYQESKHSNSLPILKRKYDESPPGDKRVKLEYPESQPLATVISQFAMTPIPATKHSHHPAQSPSSAQHPASHPISQLTAQPTLVLPAVEKEKLDFLQRYFTQLNVIGQFNTGFIIARLHPNSLFIIDQHAADEKATFEHLMRTTEIHTQPLVVPQTLHLPVEEQMLVSQHIDALASIGFRIEISKDGHFRLLTKPLSKWTVFEVSDLHEVIANLKKVQFMVDKEQVVALIRPKKYRDMFASRACRSSVMIGTALTAAKMKEIVTNLSTLDRPWNCPHGRPTIRHLFDLEKGQIQPYRPPTLANLLDGGSSRPLVS